MTSFQLYQLGFGQTFQSFRNYFSSLVSISVNSQNRQPIYGCKTFYLLVHCLAQSNRCHGNPLIDKLGYFSKTFPCIIQSIMVLPDANGITKAMGYDEEINCSPCMARRRLVNSAWPALTGKSMADTTKLGTLQKWSKILLFFQFSFVKAAPWSKTKCLAELPLPCPPPQW